MSKKIDKMIERAVNSANDNQHEYVTLEHILWSLLAEKDINQLLLNIGAQPTRIRTEIIGFLGDPALKKPEHLAETPAKRTQVRRG